MKRTVCRLGKDDMFDNTNEAQIDIDAVDGGEGIATLSDATTMFEMMSTGRKKRKCTW